MAQRDVIQRKYVQEYLKRLKAEMEPGSESWALVARMQKWVRDEKRRTKKPGGL